MAHISVVIPVYKAEACLEELYRRLKDSLEPVTRDFEIVLVEDCGGDRSWQIITGLAQRDTRVKGLQFSRNFGQHYGITAGLDNCDGDWVVVMDCDLQDRPEEIPALYNKALEGFDVVFAQRSERKDGMLKRLSSRLFYKILNYLSDAGHDAQTANFGIYHRRVIDVVRRIPERSRCFPLQVKWAGFKRAAIEVRHDARTEGKSSYNIHRLLKLAMDITLSYSDKPLRLSAYLGLTFSLAAIVYAVVVLIRYSLGEVMLLGYTSLIVSIWLLGGLSLFSLGVAGLYIGRIYESAKGRPVYIIADTTDNSVK